MVKVLTFLTVESSSVVITHAMTVNLHKYTQVSSTSDWFAIVVVAFTYHALNPCLSADWCTHGGVAIAETVATDDHIIQSVIVFFFHLLSVIIQIVT